MATVLKHMKWAADGFTIESLVPGDKRDFGSIEAGLIAEGFISLDAVEAEPTGEDAPDQEPVVEPVIEEVAPEIVPVAEPADAPPVEEARKKPSKKK